VKYDAIIIGGGPAGSVTALTARRYYPDKKILLIRKTRNSIIPCAIPYIFGTLKSVDRIKISDEQLVKNEIDILIDEVIGIDREKRRVKTSSGKILEYDKLVLATGAKPITPPIKGVNLKGVFSIYKDPDYLEELLEAAEKADRIVVIGGGFVGVEIADDLNRAGKDVYVIEILPHLLYLNFDEEFCELVENKLREIGVKFYVNTRVNKIVGQGKVEKVILSTGEEIRTDLVILATGTAPNVDLAQKSGIEIGKSGCIRVDEYLRTSDKNIFAVGDCAEKKFLFTGEPIKMMLASIATAEARIAGANLFELKVVNQVRGTIGIFSTNIRGLVLGTAGLIEREAREKGFDIITGYAEGMDRHPATLPGASLVMAKCIVAKRGEVILGWEIAGGLSAAEMINIGGIIIESGTTASKLVNMQIGTHPLSTPSPPSYPIINAVIDALSKL